jgi:hypothetical protein
MFFRSSLTFCHIHSWLFRIMRPNTFHYVLMMEHTITQGHHFYMACCGLSTAFEIVHSFVGRHTVTNELHHDAISMLRQLLCASVLYFINGDHREGKMSMPEHVIDVTTIEGLHDIIAIGNVIEFTVALDFRTYEGTELDDQEYLERETAMTLYRRFISWFSDTYGLRFGDTWVNPSYLFKHQLISFAASLQGYFSRQHANVQRQDKLKGISPTAVRRVLRHHLDMVWGPLVPRFEQLLEDPPLFLYWRGPDFRIVRKTPFRLLAEGLVDTEEVFQLDSDPIYVEAPQEPLIPDNPAHKRTSKDGPTSPPSPSRHRVAKRRKGAE